MLWLSVGVIVGSVLRGVVVVVSRVVSGVLVVVVVVVCCDCLSDRLHGGYCWVSCCRYLCCCRLAVLLLRWRRFGYACRVVVLLLLFVLLVLFVLLLLTAMVCVCLVCGYS